MFLGRNPTKRPNRKETSISTDWYSCTFESGYCGWKNDSFAEFGWSRTSKQTPTDETGPRWDHTKAGGKKLPGKIVLCSFQCNN